MQDMAFVFFLIAAILALWSYGSFLSSLTESTGLSWLMLFGWTVFPVLVLVAVRVGAAVIRLGGRLRGHWQVAREGSDMKQDPVLAYIFPRSVIERFQDKHQSLSQNDCELVVDALKHFFSAQIVSGGQLFSMPSQIADALWREFILHTREYEFFCRSVGFYMDRILKHASTDQQKITDGLQRCWSHICTVESLDSQKPSREPLLFSLDARLNIAQGIRYRADHSLPHGDENGLATKVDTIFQLEMNSPAAADEDRKALLSRDRIIRSYIFPAHAIENMKLRYPCLSSRDCDLVVVALKKYFLINLFSDRGPVSMPSMVVDVLWREFILHTKSYRLFCDAVFGHFIHHVPMGGHDEFGRDLAGLELCWSCACKEEGIDAGESVQLPLLFALDARLNIPDGFYYKPDCGDPKKQYCDGKTIYCIKEWVAGTK